MTRTLASVLRFITPFTDEELAVIELHFKPGTVRRGALLLRQGEVCGELKEYMLIFRLDTMSREAQPTEAQMAQYMQQWMQWIDGIAAKGQLAAEGNHLEYNGKVIRPGGVVVDKPYAANLESVAGYILITAKGTDDAVKIAKQCPILNGGDKNSVEIRALAPV